MGGRSLMYLGKYKLNEYSKQLPVETSIIFSSSDIFINGVHASVEDFKDINTRVENGKIKTVVFKASAKVCLERLQILGVNNKEVKEYFNNCVEEIVSNYNEDEVECWICEKKTSL